MEHILSSGPSQGTRPANTLISDLQVPRNVTIPVVCLSPHFVVLVTAATETSIPGEPMS